jgi:hypothetical protein
MRFTWIEAACILTIAIAALTNPADRGARLSASHAAPAPRSAMVADLKLPQGQGDRADERTDARAGR